MLLLSKQSEYLVISYNNERMKCYHHKQTTSTQSSGLFHAAMQSKRDSNNNVGNNGNIISCHSLGVIRWNYSTTHEATLISQHNCGRNRMILTNWNIGLEHRRCFDSPVLLIFYGLYSRQTWRKWKSTLSMHCMKIWGKPWPRVDDTCLPVTKKIIHFEFISHPDEIVAPTKTSSQQSQQSTPASLHNSNITHHHEGIERYKNINLNHRDVAATTCHHHGDTSKQYHHQQHHRTWWGKRRQQ